MSPGQLMTGGCVSLNEMIWTHLATLPHGSVAVQVRWIGWPAQLASGATRPVSSKSIRMPPPQLSLEVGLPVIDGSYGVLHSTVMSAGQTMLGGVLSTNTMCCTHVVALPQASVAFQVSGARHPAGVEARDLGAGREQRRAADARGSRAPLRPARAGHAPGVRRGLERDRLVGRNPL